MIKVGDYVRMTETFKEKMVQPCKTNGYHYQNLSEEECIYCSTEHIMEFGLSVGKVLDIDQYGDIEVNWLPTNLHYSYLPEFLQICDMKVFA